ncbi:helix-turn-helix domain-containing protein [Streptomyces sioyaensis]|uniref:helix-turn-helix domain-containing protein n=1 Tax=Streptomyces sioyaensis TaxID=67364 RepID=UPI003F5408ED
MGPAGGGTAARPVGARFRGRPAVDTEAHQAADRPHVPRGVHGAGVWKLLHRHGWSCQVPVHRAVERDEAAIEVWKEQVWPQVKEWRQTWAPTSASKTKQDRP